MRDGAQVTVYDYIWRAMPFDLPGSLTADEVYSIVAYILAEGKIINFNQTKTVDADVLSKVVMPNANGFYDGQGPDLLIYGARDKPQKKETSAKK